MAYTAEISRGNPTAFLFLIDQSGSMNDKMVNGKSKSEAVADVLNRILTTLITRCTKAEGTRDYFDIGVIGYSGDQAYNAFKGALAASVMNPISAIEAAPLRIDERNKKIDDGAGGVLEQAIKFPVWFEPNAGGATPMCQAITRAAEALATWCDAHPNSYPPTVLHVTDGEATDGDPEQLAQQLRQIQTTDGPVLLFTLHVSTLPNSEIMFPSSEQGLPDAYARLLFRMSSPLPEHLIRFAQERQLKVGLESRGFMFQASDPVQIVEFFDIGTRAAQLR